MFTIYSPFRARLFSVCDVPDPVFSASLVGPGFALDPCVDIDEESPSENRRVDVLSPCTGTVSRLTSHAVVIQSADFQWPLLVHLGIDTVSAAQKYMESAVKIDQKVKAGQVLFRWELARMVKEGLDPTTMVVAMQCPQPRIFGSFTPQVVQSGQKLFSFD